MQNRSGVWKKNLYGEAAYKSFVPAKLPPVPDIALDEDGLQLLGKANKELANVVLYFLMLTFPNQPSS